MCGRFALKAPPRSIQEHFQLQEEVEIPPRFNIAPSQAIAVVRQLPEEDLRRLDMLRWGLIPFWAKDEKISYKMINGRAETLTQKPSFRVAFKKRRCLIAADGFYEWHNKGKAKQPLFVQLITGAVFAFAGLWEFWRSPEGNIVESCTIITTAPNELLLDIHDRMPVIIPPEHYETWLQSVTREETLQALLAPYPEEKMEVYRVGSTVNSPKNDMPECIEPM